MYSFSASAHSSAREGLSLNTHRFKGNETLQILFNANLANSQVDIYAFTEAVLEIGTTGVSGLTRDAMTNLDANIAQPIPWE
jgi:hypothetical protein